MKVKINLPWPPSVNRIWKTTSKGGWYSTKEAKEYRISVTYLAIAAGIRNSFPSGNVRVCLFVYPPDKRKIDLDNRAKVILDALQDAKVYNNDSQIKILHMEMLEVRKGGFVTVIINKLDGHEIGKMEETSNGSVNDTERQEPDNQA
jgi:crossover junction endodeoxyribonuclease RusA